MSPSSRRIPQTAELLSLLFALLLVLSIAVLSYRAWVAFGRLNEQPTISQQVANKTYSLLSSLKDAETGQRGFLLTGDDKYLEPYEQALRETPYALDDLAGVVAARRQDQVERVDRLKHLVQEKLDELKRTIDVRRSQGMDAAVAIVRTDRGKLAMDQIRTLGAEIQKAANEREARFSADARDSANRMGLIAVIGSALLFVLLALSMLPAGLHWLTDFAVLDI